MRHETRMCSVAAARECLWDYLADYDHVVRLASPSASARHLAGEPGSIGAQYEAKVLWEGLPSLYSAVLADGDRPLTLTWTGKANGGVGSIRFDFFSASEGATDVIALLEYEADRSIMPLEPFAWGLLTRLLDVMIDRLGELELSESRS